MAQAMKGVTRAMQKMNNQLKLPQIQVRDRLRQVHKLTHSHTHSTGANHHRNCQTVWFSVARQSGGSVETY